jgi:hypothetical protein
LLAEGAAGAVWVAAGAEGATELTGACEAEGADAGFATTAGRAAGTTFTGALVGTFDGDDGVEGVVEVAGAEVTEETAGTAPEAAALGAEAAGSDCSGGNTCSGGGGSTGGVGAGFCMTAAKPKAAANKAMMNHKEFLDFGLSSLSKAEFVDFCITDVSIDGDLR